MGKPMKLLPSTDVRLASTTASENGGVALGIKLPMTGVPTHNDKLYRKLYSTTRWVEKAIPIGQHPGHIYVCSVWDFSGAASGGMPGRNFLIDSGASFHLIG